MVVLYQRNSYCLSFLYEQEISRQALCIPEVKAW